ncbi:MAG: hypothetical protein A2017_18210 [Lentisphaerae bacterium GWF2_44_16]|nr:MAG: hypothetical protein A2017_18210 [Lentisphaerae bacterium GWF2_44_16]
MLKAIVEVMAEKEIKGVGLMISKMDEEKIRVVVSPVKKDGGAVQNFVATDTVENLERDLPGLIAQYREIVAGNNLDELRKKSPEKKAAKSDGKLKTVEEKIKEKTAPEPESDSEEVSEAETEDEIFELNF